MPNLLISASIVAAAASSLLASPVGAAKEAAPGVVVEVRRLGYDLVLVVDTTAGMQQWFRPAAQALEDLVATVKDQIGQSEDRVPFRTALLFFRDRKAVPDCDIGYLFRWEVGLTPDVSAVIRALGAAREADCSSDETAEAIYDALSRAVQDPKWNDGHFKVVLLLTDAPPHPPSNALKNPLGLDVDSILNLAEERNVRFMVFKIGPFDDELKALAMGAKAAVEGRLRLVEPKPASVRRDLLALLLEEWDLLEKGNQVVRQGISRQLP